MASPPNMTIAVAQVLRQFLDNPTGRYGAELRDRTGIRSGSLYPILGRLEGAGWLTSRQEDIDPHTEGRPARRYYALTELGTTEARRRLTDADGRLRAVSASLADQSPTTPDGGQP